MCEGSMLWRRTRSAEWLRPEGESDGGARPNFCFCNGGWIGGLGWLRGPGGRRGSERSRGGRGHRDLFEAWALGYGAAYLDGIAGDGGGCAGAGEATGEAVAGGAGQDDCGHEAAGGEHARSDEEGFGQ